MAETKTSASTIFHLPITQAVGAVINVPTSDGGSRSAKVPAAATLLINGQRTPLIDVRAMSAATIAQFINAMGCGARARIDGNGRLIIENVGSFEGDGDLRAFFGL